MEKEFYSRNLPHIQLKGSVFFITYRLAGSLPKNIIESFFDEKNIIKDYSISGFNKNWRSEILFKDRFFKKFNHLLDNPSSGPVWLSNPRIAEIVKKSFHFLDESDYHLICYSIMPNHVHLILHNCKRPLYKILQSLKRHTARESNILLNRKGPFWHKESYDNVVQDMNDLSKKINYVLENPVKAGIVNNREEHPYTYCDPKYFKYLES